MIVSTLRGPQVGIDGSIDLFEGFFIASPERVQFHDRSPDVIEDNNTQQYMCAQQIMLRTISGMN